MEFNLSALGSAPAAEETYDVVIIGGGPAGLTAGIYAGRAQLKTVIVEKGLPGGQIAQTDEVENYPGFPEGISGPELASRMVRQAEKFGARIVMDEVLGLEKAEGGYLVRGYERNYRARAVIVATGANPRRLGVPGEDKFYGRGFPPAPPATASSTGTRRWSWWVGGTPPWRRGSSSPSSPEK